MSLQWSAVATFLYAEVFLVLLLCVPFVSAARWQKIFRSRAVGAAVSYGNGVFIVIILLLLVLLLDALRESRRYEVGEGPVGEGPPRERLKLFRAQRNLHLAGLSLLLALLLRRLVSLLSAQAALGASSRALQGQGQGAGRAARAYLEENEHLRQQLQQSGGGDAAPAGGEGQNLRETVGKLRQELESGRAALQAAERRLRAERLRAEGLSREHERLRGEHQRLRAAQDARRDKKKD